MWPPGTPRHHLYVVVAGSQPHAAHVDFRDHLRRHPDVAAEYATLKRALAERHPHDRPRYESGTDAFVAGVLRAARGAAT